MSQERHLERVLAMGLGFATSLSTSGCSFAFVRGPPARLEPSAPEVQAPATKPDCSTSNGWPIVDTVLASVLIGLGVTLVVAGAAEKKCTGGGLCGIGPTPEQAVGVGLGLGALGGVLLTSGIVGFNRTSGCRRAIEPAPPAKLPPPVVMPPVTDAGTSP